MTARPWLLVSVLAALVVATIVFPPWFAFCDGNAPGWVENDGGCAEWSLWEYLLPWHWGVPEQCLGMCLDSVQP